MIVAYQPQIQVTLVKTRRRTSLGQTLDRGADVSPAAGRLGQIVQIDLTPYVMDGGGVHTQKSTREPAGGFTIVLRESPVAGDSLYGLIEPMDLIEIRMGREAAVTLPLVMRGLVSNVKRSESFGEAGPQRSITVAGQDFGRLLEMLRIYYLRGSVVGEIWLDSFKFFRQYKIDDKPRPAKDFFTDVIQKVLDPYLQKVFRITDGQGLTVAVPKTFDPVCTISGIVSPLGVASFPGGSLYELLAQFLDVGPFNELYVQDRGDSVALVCRPCPWRDLAGATVDRYATFDTMHLDETDLMVIEVSRSDAGVANYFWVGNGAFELQNNGDLQLATLIGDPTSYLAFDYVNTDETLYGLRKMETESRLGDPLGLAGDGMPEGKTRQERVVNARWLDKRRRFLMQSNRDNVVLESGRLQLKGNPSIMAGQYLEIRRGGLTASYYAVAVVHSFVPAQGYFTDVLFERGTGFVERQKHAGSPWFDERNEKGAT